jgi:predicted ribosome quality control (RQC) complex YloA/Tae2 family protein
MTRANVPPLPPTLEARRYNRRSTVRPTFPIAEDHSSDDVNSRDPLTDSFQRQLVSTTKSPSPDLGIHKSLITAFFDVASPHLFAQFTAPPIPAVDANTEQFRVQEQSRNAELALSQLNNDVNSLESAFPLVQQDIANVGAQATEAQTKIEALQIHLRELDRVCDNVRQTNADAKMLVFQWALQIIAWVLWVLRQGKRFIGSPKAFLGREKHGKRDGE